MRACTFSLGILAILGLLSSSSAQAQQPKTAPKTAIDYTGEKPAKPAAGLAKAPADVSDLIYLLHDDTLADRYKRLPINPSHFQNELIRQGFWLTAREEFGLRVRDASLGESIPDGLPEDRQFRLRESRQVKAPWTLTVGRKNEFQIWGGGFVLSKDDADTFQVLPLASSERLTRGFHRECLEAAGFEHKPNRSSEAPVPAAIEELLGQMREVDQFAAVRLLHAEIRDKGESEALLGALARGYANLGLLTEFYLGRTPLVFKARALLYAQRLLVRAPKSAVALWTRAYAAALAGTHFRALTDLENAAKLAAGPPAATPPSWVELIDAYVHFDAVRLDKARKAKDSSLARLLLFLAVEEPLIPTATIKAGQVFLSLDQECYRVHDSMCRTGGVSNLHSATSQNMAAFQQHLAGRLRQLPGIPEGIPASFKNAERESQLYAELRKAGRPGNDRGEPSWDALGSLLRDLRMTQYLHRLDFVARMLALPTHELADEALAALQGHPLQPLLESYAVKNMLDSVAIRQALHSVPHENLDLRASAYFWRLMSVDREVHSILVKYLMVKVEGLYYNDVSYVRLINPATAAAQKRGKTLERISPHSPTTQAFLVAEGDLQPKIPELEKKYQDQAVVQRALGDLYFANKKYADAARCWSRLVALSPDGSFYQKLAQAYRADGKDDRWSETLEESLKSEDQGLDHAQVRVQLANHFMHKKDFKRAEPFARDAAASGAEWAFLCLADWHMGMKEWDNANEVLKGSASRYTGSAFEWYLACRATREMDIASAEKAVMSLLDKSDLLPQRISFQAGLHYLLINKLEKAQAAFSREDALSPTSLTALYAAMTADLMKNEKLRDQMLQKMDKLPDTQTGKQIGKMVLRWQTLAGTPSDETIAADIKKLPESARATGEFIAGWYLHNRRLDERAKLYLTSARNDKYLMHWVVRHAAVLLEEGKK